VPNPAVKERSENPEAPVGANKSRPPGNMDTAPSVFVCFELTELVAGERIGENRIDLTQAPAPQPRRTRRAGSRGSPATSSGLLTSRRSKKGPMGHKSARAGNRTYHRCRTCPHQLFFTCSQTSFVSRPVGRQHITGRAAQQDRRVARSETQHRPPGRRQRDDRPPGRASRLKQYRPSGRGLSGQGPPGHTPSGNRQRPSGRRH